MKVTSEVLSQSYAVTIVEDNLDYIKKSKEKLWSDFKKKNIKLIREKISGFRPENVPRSLGEGRFDFGQLYEKLLNEILTSGLKQTNLDVVSINKTDVEVGSGDSVIVITAEVEIIPTVRLGQYKGLNVKYKLPKVTDGEIDAVLQRMRESSGKEIEIKDRPVQENDTVYLEFVGIIDGVEFEGGSTKAPDGTHNPYAITVGSCRFIKGFEEQLIGMKIDEIRKITVKCPEDHPKAEFRSKEMVFDVTLKRIVAKELPELNDEFVKLSGYQNIADAKNRLKEDLLASKKNTTDSEIESDILTLLDKNCTVSPIPEKIVKKQLDLEFGRVLKQLRLNEQEYFEKTHTTRRDFDRLYRITVVRDTRLRHILENIAVEEKIEISEQELENILKEEAGKFRVTLEQLKSKPAFVEKIRKDSLINKTVALIRASAVIEPEVEAKVTEVVL